MTGPTAPDSARRGDEAARPRSPALDPAVTIGRRAVQDTWPALTCWGCGPANPEGLRLRSYASPDGRTLAATFRPRSAFDSGWAGVAYGGLLASLVDCNSIWTAMVARNRADGLPPDAPPAVRYVTSRLSVDYLRPTPLDRPIHVRSRVDGPVGRRTRVLTELGPVGRSTTAIDPRDPVDEPTATGEVLAVAVEDPPDGEGPGVASPDGVSANEPTPDAAGPG